MIYYRKRIKFINIDLIWLLDKLVFLCIINYRMRQGIINVILAQFQHHTFEDALQVVSSKLNLSRIIVSNIFQDHFQYSCNGPDFPYTGS
jgi:hypothetical protein